MTPRATRVAASKRGLREVGVVAARGRGPPNWFPREGCGCFGGITSWADRESHPLLVKKRNVAGSPGGK